jgi:hypothetical protein
LLLVGLLALHVGVQVYGYAAPYRWGIYGGILDATLGLVVLHGFLGVRAAVVGTTLSDGVKRTLIWTVGLMAVALFLVRIIV